MLTEEVLHFFTVHKVQPSREFYEFVWALPIPPVPDHESLWSWAKELFK
jgi:hypothetical protein